VVSWLWRLGGWRVHPPAWLVVVGLVTLLVVLAIGLVALWPRSLRWASANRLHRVAARNEAEIRSDTRRHLDRALRCLVKVRGDQEFCDRHDDAAQLGRLISQLEVVRDCVATDYVPSPANAPRLGREVDLVRLTASETIERECDGLMKRMKSGRGLSAAMESVHQALKEVDDRRFELQ
jgi:hypothetical protein